MKLNKSQRLELRQKFGGRCAYCGCELGDKFHADHVEAIYRETEIVPRHKRKDPLKFEIRQTGKSEKQHLDALENLYPACVPCNLFKSVFSVEQFRKEITQQVERARAYSVNFRTAERFGLVQEVVKPVVFWFEVYIGEAK